MEQRAMPKRDIIERLRDSSYHCVSRDRLAAADEIERLRAELARLRKFGPVNQAVVAERAAILELIESFARSWDQDDVTSWHEAAKRIAVAIKARGET